LADVRISEKEKTMAHTEKEANEMQCCGPSDCGAAYESNLDGVYFRFCTASRCMAWRWCDQVEKDILGEEYLPNEKRLGFCGLAGKP
jgi:hypothetical protein